MINSINSLEFLKSKLLNMNKYSSTTSPTKILSPTSLTTISDHQKIRTIDSLQEKFMLSNETKNQDRVMVQHLQNHSNLQNNKCNTFRTLYNNISASSDVREGDMFQMYQPKDDSDVDVVNVEQLQPTTETMLSLENKSAFNVDLNRKYQKITVGNKNLINDKDTSVVTETNRNLQMYCKQYKNCSLINIQSPKTQMILMPTEIQINAIETQRNEDQDHAYRHIESVHNYAKSKSLEGDDDKASPNDSRHSSYLDDEDDEEEDDEVNGAPEYDNDDNIDYEDRLPANLETEYEDIFNNRRCQRVQKLPNQPETLSSKGWTSTELQKRTSFANILKDHKLQHIKLKNNKINNKYEDEEVHVDVDVETVDTQLSPNTCLTDTNPLLANNFIDDETAGCIKPDHHARRPMNAFLIFCKRHRAIVKDRYKNLENRAITKILGDWWASLDSNEKKCFTNLAQQNKDAFFSANPNFKWYKLPAPPLRTLTTRPANALSQEFQEDNGANSLDMINSISRYNNNNSNYFKLADEAEMGDLSQLMEDKSKTLKQCADLQQALGETSQFISAHISSNSDILEENRLKRRLCNENSFSGNSSEEDLIEPKKKNARSCKGKRYQELINSGQIATALKKSKSSTRPISEDAVVNAEINIKQNCSNHYNLNDLNDCQKRSLSENENILSYDLNSFDLEDKIKELPALNLDDYLQRKRSTKKKKKFSCNGKKRGQRSNNTNNASKTDNNATVTNTSQSEERLEQQLQMVKYHQQQHAVGSQKRKARKESITRRDVSTIEQEVASLLPLTINGCCYFQETPLIIKNEEITNKTTSEANWRKSQSLSFTSTSPIIPFKRESSSPVSIGVLNSINAATNNIFNDNISSTTSDLLILAEVAANRTELK